MDRFDKAEMFNWSIRFLNTALAFESDDPNTKSFDWVADVLERIITHDDSVQTTLIAPEFYDAIIVNRRLLEENGIHTVADGDEFFRKMILALRNREQQEKPEVAAAILKTISNNLLLNTEKSRNRVC